MFAAAAQGRVSQLERVAIFSLTPVFAIVLEPHLGNARQPAASSLVAALAAVAGALCIFPLDLPGTPAAAIAVLAMVLAAACAATGNCLAVRIASSSAAGSLALGAALASGSAAFVFAVASVITEHAQWQFMPKTVPLAWMFFIDLPALMLLFWLLRHMSAARMTMRFILAPLLTILAGIALEQPAITTRMILGIVLMTAGALWLLLAPVEDIERSAIRIL
jgi:drug/metabolite transporter (DMT)-like permease